MFFYALLGVIAAVWATGFVRMLYFFEDRFEEFKIPAWVKGGIGFGLVGVIGIWIPQIFGVGYVSMQQVLDQHVGAESRARARNREAARDVAHAGLGRIGRRLCARYLPAHFSAMRLDASYISFFPLWTVPGAAYGLVGMAALCRGIRSADDGDYHRLRDVKRLPGSSSAHGVRGYRNRAWRRMLGSTVYEMK